MPSFFCSSTVRALSDNFSLSLDVRHNLVANEPSDSVYSIKARLPEDVDVLLSSNLVLTLSGLVDRVKVSSENVRCSAIANNLLCYLETNAEQLGINTISDVYIDEEDKLAKINLTPSRSLPINGSRHATLVSIDLTYTWRTLTSLTCNPSCDVASSAHPFATRLLLPFETLLNRVVEKFVSLHLVRRYPLIFGPWCQKLDIESAFFSPVAHSVLRIMERSPNYRFCKSSKRLVKSMTTHNATAFVASSAALSDYLGPSVSEDASEMSQDRPEASYEETLSLCMECLYRTCVPRSRFKGSALGSRENDADGDNEGEFDLSQSQDSNTDASDPVVGQAWDPLLWDHPSDTARVPYTPSVPEDVDELWFDDEDWQWRSSGGIHDPFISDNDEDLANHDCSDTDLSSRAMTSQYSSSSSDTSAGARLVDLHPDLFRLKGTAADRDQTWDQDVDWSQDDGYAACPKKYHPSPDFRTDFSLSSRPHTLLPPFVPISQDLALTSTSTLDFDNGHEAKLEARLAHPSDHSTDINFDSPKCMSDSEILYGFEEGVLPLPGTATEYYSHSQEVVRGRKRIASNGDQEDEFDRHQQDHRPSPDIDTLSRRNPPFDALV